MDICTYCPTSIACKCGYNCANCLKAKDTHKKCSDAHGCSQKLLFGSQSEVTILQKQPNNHACGDKTQEKEKRKAMFKERQKQPKTTSWYCFKNMRYNNLSCCTQCFQIIETTMVTK